MNKAPQPITGPPSTPRPAPSPGLSQPSFPPGQPPSVVFATPPPPQMNPTPQARQPFYPNRGSLPPGSGPRGVPPSNAPRPVTPTHVYQPGPGSQMMMIPGQQLSFPSSAQAPAYFIPGQYRSATYVATAQQYPGTPGFYPGTSPAEYAGAYYPAQPQFTPSVQAAPVIMNPAPQQQQPPPQPPQHIPTKRERKQIRIRDPNQGGRDITEEIMSGGRSGSTPTPPQSAISGSENTAVVQANGESITAATTTALVRPDDRDKPTPPPLSKTPEPSKGDPIPTEASSSDTNTKPPIPPLLSEAADHSLNTLTPSAPVAEVMDAPPREPTPTPQSAPEVPAYPAPLPDPVPTLTAQDKTDTKAAQEEEMEDEEVETKTEEAAASLDITLAPLSTTNGVAAVEPEELSIELPPSQLEAPLDSPIAQPEELRLPNGLPIPDPEAHALCAAERDDSPIAEPDVSQQPIIETSTAITLEAPPPVVQATTEPVDQPTPEAAVQEIPEELVVPAVPAQTEVEETSPAVTEVDIEDSPVPETTAKEQMPSPPEPVSLAESTPETVPSPPPPTAEEKEDVPPPQTVTPALVETTMQAAVSVPKKKRKMKDLNKMEAVGDLLDAFKESIVSLTVDKLTLHLMMTHLFSVILTFHFFS
ncbi:hypothetical protein JOB18_036918 [Solea senegalensis]|uniref:Eukaryotic translation initiation factor 4 gamma 1 n=2 Tax=Solea senegalensis TaxID=28829 RepID=A0AAV6PDX4_SOLSE|nr:hypothetical protein JOB18_036918 [Solea senegalensis]